MAGVKGVPVIPTAVAALYGRGQRLEGSLVAESVAQARGRRPTRHSGRIAVPVPVIPTQEPDSMAGVKGVPVIPTAVAVLYGRGQRRPCHVWTLPVSQEAKRSFGKKDSKMQSCIRLLNEEFSFPRA